MIPPHHFFDEGQSVSNFLGLKTFFFFIISLIKYVFIWLFSSICSAQQVRSNIPGIDSLGPTSQCHQMFCKHGKGVLVRTCFDFNLTSLLSPSNFRKSAPPIPRVPRLSGRAPHIIGMQRSAAHLYHGRLSTAA